MSNINKSKIQELWANKQCPIVNGIIYGNGEIKRIEIVRDKLWKFQMLTAKPESQTTIIDFLRNKPDDLTSLTQLYEKSVTKDGINIIAGEGGWGSDGFVAVEYLNTKELLFLLFFDNSNPFVEIDFFDSNIIATNNLEERWTIPVKEPEKLKVFES